MQFEWAVPGAQCVCINDDWDWAARMDAYSVPIRVPMIGEVLTVREVIPSKQIICGVGLVFWEIPKNQCDGPLCADLWWAARCFRPLETKKTDISSLEALLISKPETVEA